MNVRPIRTEKEHRAALREIEVLWGAAEGTAEGDKLDVLLALVDIYEERRLADRPGQDLRSDRGASLRNRGAWAYPDLAGRTSGIALVRPYKLETAA